MEETRKKVSFILNILNRLEKLVYEIFDNN